MAIAAEGGIYLSDSFAHAILKVDGVGKAGVFAGVNSFKRKVLGLMELSNQRLPFDGTKCYQSIVQFPINSPNVTKINCQNIIWVPTNR